MSNVWQCHVSGPSDQRIDKGDRLLAPSQVEEDDFPDPEVALARKAAAEQAKDAS